MGNHRQIVEKLIRRKLIGTEEVHHINRNPEDRAALLLNDAVEIRFDTKARQELFNE